MKQDLNSTNTHTNNHCRWKSGYPSYQLIAQPLKPPSRFRKKDSQNRTPRKTGQPAPHRAPVIRFLHRPHPAILRRPLPSVGISTNRNKMRRLPCTRFSQTSSRAEENQLQTVTSSDCVWLSNRSKKPLNLGHASQRKSRRKQTFIWGRNEESVSAEAAKSSRLDRRQRLLPLRWSRMKRFVRLWGENLAWRDLSAEWGRLSCFARW